MKAIYVLLPFVALLVMSANCKGYEGTEPLVDIDGNVYATVRYGDYVYMADNLRVTRTRNGTPIPVCEDDSTWYVNDFRRYGAKPYEECIPLVCYYDNDRSLSARYGALYNLFCDSLCPDGWENLIFPFADLDIELAKTVITVKSGYRTFLRPSEAGKYGDFWESSFIGIDSLSFFGGVVYTNDTAFRVMSIGDYPDLGLVAASSRRCYRPATKSDPREIDR